MPHLESRDEQVARKANDFAVQIRAVAAEADSEEEIRVAVERQLAFVEKEVGVKLEGRHEFTIAKGRIDSLYSRVIIEYKNPSDTAARIGPRPDSPGTIKVVEQIKRRFYDLRTEQRQPLNTLFGVGLDGKFVVFVRFRDDKWHVHPKAQTRFSASGRSCLARFAVTTSKPRRRESKSWPRSTARRPAPGATALRRLAAISCDLRPAIPARRRCAIPRLLDRG